LSHQHHDASRAEGRRALWIVLALTTTFLVVEVIGGLVADSLALLADAGHMLSDVLSLGVALFASWLASRPGGPSRTFGYRRAEILAALFNGVSLIAISIWIFVEAGIRFGDPPDVEAGLMLAVAAVGLVVNLVAARIGILILASSWSILRDSLQILLEGSPPGTDVREVGSAMAATDGVKEVHDLHVWTITSGFPALAAHVLVDRDTDCHATRRELEAMLHERFGLDHTTLQVDHEGGELLQIET
jgi:cobalt-zinc-cadmium efflux system protein